MKKKTFDEFRELIYRLSGITLADHKLPLVKSRVSKRMRFLKIHDSHEYLNFVKNDNTGQEIVQLLDAISTNVTNFFREKDHFKFFNEHMSNDIKKGKRRFRFWCAGCSSGEEPYTLAMVINEVLLKFKLSFSDIDIKILATDISTKVLNIALTGSYPVSKVDGLSQYFLSKYFTTSFTENGKMYTIQDNIKRIVVFKRLNLSTVPFPMKGPLDCIFCRNTMIYFDNRVKSNLIREFERLISPYGFLMIGHSESLAGLNSHFVPVNPAIYRLNIS